MKILTIKSQSSLIDLKDLSWLRDQQHAGRCVNSILFEIENYLSTPNLSLKDLEVLALKYFNLYECKPTFLNYKGFPSAICVSINNQLVHGVVTDYKLQQGDLITVDLGATYNDSIADAARTWIYGEAKSQQHLKLLDVCKTALQKAIEVIKIDSQIGAIGRAIHKYVSSSGFSVITQYGGHGIGRGKPHDLPFIANKASSNEGIRIQPGLSIAIEPMVVIGEAKTTVSQDGWTVYTPGLGCHFEDSITIMDDGIYNITGFLK